jgi:hypothetical protein
MVIGVLFAAVTLINFSAYADETAKAPHTLCGDANSELFARLREASAMERDPNANRGVPPSHGAMRAPAGFDPRFQPQPMQQNSR